MEERKLTCIGCPHGMSASGHNKGWDSGKSYGKYL